MANQNLTTEQTQFILNRAKNATYNTLDVTPMVEVSNGVLAPVGYQAQLPVSTALGLRVYDYIGVVYPAADTETYTFKSGGSGGTTLSTVTIVYTTATKEFISSVTKT